jgi:hypothetical protein
VAAGKWLVVRAIKGAIKDEAGRRSQIEALAPFILAQKLPERAELLPARL